MTGDKNKNIKTAFLLKNNLIWQNKQSSLIYNVQLNIYRRLSECPVPLNCSARRFDFRALTAAVEILSSDASQSFGTWFEIEKQRIFFEKMTTDSENESLEVTNSLTNIVGGSVTGMIILALIILMIWLIRKREEKAKRLKEIMNKLF